MKKLLVLLVIFLLVGCSKDKLEIIEIHPNQYTSMYESTPIGVSENGLYYIRNEILYFKGNNEPAVPLGSINYENGKRENPFYNIYYEKVRSDHLLNSEIICYGERIYMKYYTFNHDGSKYSQLASVDLKGDDFKTHIIFDYEPQQIRMNNGKIYVGYHNFETDEDYIETYNNSFELINTEYYDDYINGFYVENDEIVVPKGDVAYEGEGIKIINSVELDSNDKFKTTGIIQIGEKEFTFDNKTIQFVNDKYFYVVSDYIPQTYERYHLNGELDKSIVISEHIKTEGIIELLTELDFSYMLKLKDENVAYGYSGHDYWPRIFEVNFEKGTCNYVGE